jgi:hypothetical protein
MITWALVVSSIGYSLVVVAGIIFKDFVVRKYIEHSPEIVIYYDWIFVLGYGLMIYTVLEAFSWNFHKSVSHKFPSRGSMAFVTTIIIFTIPVRSYSRL